MIEFSYVYLVMRPLFARFLIFKAGSICFQLFSWVINVDVLLPEPTVRIHKSTFSRSFILLSIILRLQFQLIFPLPMQMEIVKMFSSASVRRSQRPCPRPIMSTWMPSPLPRIRINQYNTENPFSRRACVTLFLFSYVHFTSNCFFPTLRFVLWGLLVANRGKTSVEKLLRTIAGFGRHTQEWSTKL